MGNLTGTAVPLASNFLVPNGTFFVELAAFALIGLFPAWLSWAPTAGWKLFDMAIGVIQAFIFALLTLLYFSFQLPSEEGH